jgi:hypothetical protein
MKNLLLILLLFLSWGTTYAINIFSMDFSSDTTSAFSAAGDTGDMTLSWNSSEGALSIKGVNSADNIGKAYIGLANFAVPPLSAEGVTITYDLKYDGPMANAAIHFLSGNPGAAFFQALDLHTQGINENTWTSFEHTISGITPGHTGFQAQFQIAAGAIPGAGGTLLVDKIVISQVPEPSTYALIAGLAIFVPVALRRKLN